MTIREEVRAENQAISQQDQILEYLFETGQELTAWQLKEVFPNWEITSIRRSLFNLEMKLEKIIQTGFVPGPKGKPVGKYKSK